MWLFLSRSMLVYLLSILPSLVGQGFFAPDRWICCCHHPAAACVILRSSTLVLARSLTWLLHMRMCIRRGFWGAVAECVGIPRWHALILVKWLVCDLLTRSYIGLLIWCTLLIRYLGSDLWTGGWQTNWATFTCYSSSNRLFQLARLPYHIHIYVAPGLVMNLLRCLSKLAVLHRSNCVCNACSCEGERRWCHCC